jgi:predicted nucleic acid-binding protein
VKRLLIDVNVVLDALLARPRHSDAASRLWVAVESKRLEAMVPAHGVTTLFYLIGRARGAAAARRTVAGVIGVFGVAAVDEAVIRRAVALEWPDFEDAVCAAAAEASGCDGIVTRDPKGFRGCALPVLSAETAVALMGGTPPDRVGERPTTRGRAAAGPRGQGRTRRGTAGPASPAAARS